jgi:hypothetical protein
VDRFGGGFAAEDCNGCSGHQAVALGELQEFRALVQDAGDVLGRVQRAIGEAHSARFVDVAFGGGDWIAMRVGGWVAEQCIDPFEDPVGDCVFERICLGVNFGPIEFEDLHKEQFDKAMAAEDVEGELLAAAGEADAAARLVFDESGIGEGFDH